MRNKRLFIVILAVALVLGMTGCFDDEGIDDGIEVSVTGVTLDKTQISLAVGGAAETLTATVAPSDATNRAVTWASSNTAIATVSNGVVHPVAAGSAIITVITVEGKKPAFCTVTVTNGGSGTVTNVTGVSLNKEYTSLLVGAKETLTSTISPNNATNKNVTWSSDKTAVATVANGVVTGVSAGIAIITVTTDDGGKTATCEVTVTTNAIHVKSIILSQTSLPLVVNGVNDHATLTLAFFPEDATNQNVTWRSSNDAVALVSSGNVLARSSGTATITVTTDDGNKTATCTVTVTVPVNRVTLNKTSIDLDAGMTETLVAVFEPSDPPPTNRNVTWASSNNAVATVSTSGLVTAVNSGVVTVGNSGRTAIITVTAVDDPTKTATCTVTVTVRVSSVILNTSNAGLLEGATNTLIPIIQPATATNTNVTWSSDNNAVATVSTSGVVTGVAAGTATITVATVDGGKTATCKFTVSKVVVPVTGVSLKKNTASLNVGATETLTATIQPTTATNTSVTWTSSDTTVATVSTSGVVTGVGPRTATITVTTADGSYTATCTVTVSAVPVTGVTLNKTTLSLNVEGITTLTETIVPATATNKIVTWTSSDLAVATVSPNGVVSAGKSAGTTNITVRTTEGGFIATCVVTVIVPVSHVTLNWTTYDLTFKTGLDTVYLNATVEPNPGVNQAVTWSSSNQNIAKVDNTGKVTATGTRGGTATITATAVGDTNKTDTCKVTVILPVTGVALSDTQLTLVKGVNDTNFLSATLTPANATTKTVTWKSSRPEVATVTASGGGINSLSATVNLVSAGTTNIYVNANDTTNGDFYAACTVTVKYRVSFDSQGGTDVPSQSSLDGKVELPRPEPTKDGYDFDGWYEESFLTRFDFDNTKITNNITLYAKWKIKTYTVKFDSFGGSPAPSNQTIEFNGKAKRPTDPTRDDYNFDGWYRNLNSSQKFNFPNTPITEDITLYAKWIQAYTVTFDSNDGSSTPLQKQTVNTGANAIEPTNPSRTDFDFLYWYKDQTSRAKFDFKGTSITEDITLYAKWRPNIAMERINSGTFLMGKNEEVENASPEHKVTLNKAFYMGKYEVTQEQYEAVMGSSNPSNNKVPVVNVSWYDAIVFCNLLSMAYNKTPAYTIGGSTDPAVWIAANGGIPDSSNSTWNNVTLNRNTGYRLPTEAEWEYAARGGQKSKKFTYSGSNNLSDVAWFNTDATHEVGKKTGNELDLFDMSGNVPEWCWDWFETTYTLDPPDDPDTPQVDPTGPAIKPASSVLRVRRGGAYNQSKLMVFRPEHRVGVNPWNRNSQMGFRVVLPD